MPKTNDSLQELLIDELQDLYDAEKQLVRALPKIANAASNEELGNAIREHLEVTKGQVERLERVFAALESRPKSRPCAGMRGLVEEGQHIMEEEMEDAAMDLALSGASRKVEHYEMVGYESVVSIAKQLGRKDAAELLQETMNEEQQADRQLAAISKRLMQEAARMPKRDESEEGMRTESRSAKAPSRSSKSGKASTSNGSRQAGGRASSKTGGRAGRKIGGRAAQPLTDHEEIRQWAEERNARPACVRKTGRKGDVGMIRLDFPGYSGGDSLQEISWDEWFEKFDESNLALIVQDRTANQQQSNFNKLVKREGSAKPKTRAAG
jgi:ferritin-like metal-binding protein YciE